MKIGVMKDDFGHMNLIVDLNEYEGKSTIEVQRGDESFLLDKEAFLIS